MSKRRERKTNAMRILDAAGLAYQARFFDRPASLGGKELAQLLGIDGDRLFKTLVSQAGSGAHYVFMIPVARELDLRKAAAAAGEKSISLIRLKELLPLTGYVHGGCSPLAMARSFPTVIDESSRLFDRIVFSGGRIGCQIEMDPLDLARVLPLAVADLVQD